MRPFDWCHRQSEPLILRITTCNELYLNWYHFALNISEVKTFGLCHQEKVQYTWCLNGQIKEPNVQHLKVHQLTYNYGKYHGPAGLLGLFENNKRLSLSCWIWSNFEDFCEEMIASECINVWMYECKINEYLWIPSSLAMHHKVPFDALNSFSYPANYSNTEIKNYSNTEINESHPGLAASSLTVQWMFMHLHCIHANIGLTFLNT